MIIDFHTHTFPENLAPSALNKLTSMSKVTPYGLATEKDLLDKMKISGIDKSVILSIATKVEQVEVINRYNVNNKNENLIFFGAMHPDYPNIDSEIDFLHKNGIKGIKMHPEFQNFYPSDKKYYQIYKSLSERNMIIVFHSGKEEFMTKSEYFSHPKHFSAIHSDFPELKMVIAHFGAHDMFEEAKKFILGKNIYVDTSYDLKSENISLLKNLLKYHSSDFILYGSDWPWRDLGDYLKLTNETGINKNILSKILGDNSKELLHL